MRGGEAYRYEGYAASALAQALRRSDDFDVVHSHVGPIGIPIGEASSVSVIHTVHEGLDSVDQHWLLDRHRAARVVAISDSQVSSVPVDRRRSIVTVYHGLDLAEFEASPDSDDYVLFLGRMGWQKNPAGAIRIARAAGTRIVLAGGPQDTAEREYFRTEVEPLLGWDGVEYVGQVSHMDKLRLLRRANALVFPIRWDEHFGLVMIEAMASGTPVVGMRRGSVPEIVEDGITGYHGSSESELAKKLGDIDSLDRATVARRARERFSLQRMTDDYLAIYSSVIGVPAAARPG
jgi:glycosyltransferase involved in cell wall biosynthesis